MNARLTLIVVAMFIFAGVFLAGVPLETVSAWFGYTLFALAAIALVEIAYFAYRSRPGDRWRAWGSGFMGVGVLGLGLVVHFGTVMPPAVAIVLMVMAVLVFLAGNALQSNAGRASRQGSAEGD